MSNVRQRGTTPELIVGKVLEKSDVAKMLKAAEGKSIYTPILLAVTTGMRRGELLGLRWSDIDFLGSTLKVNRALVDTKKNGLELKEPKSEAGKREIALPAITIDELKRYRNSQAERFLKLGVRPGNDDLVFLSIRENGTVGPRRPRDLTKAFTRFITKVDVPQITLHGLRHTHITHLLMDNVPITLVSDRAGHSSVQITLDVYGHIFKECQKTVVSGGGMLQSTGDC